MTKQKVFNKIDAYDELAIIMNPGSNPKMSEIMKATSNAIDFLQKIHDEAFENGFNSGCEAKENVDKL